MLVDQYFFSLFLWVLFLNSDLKSHYPVPCWFLLDFSGSTLLYNNDLKFCVYSGVTLGDSGVILGVVCGLLCRYSWVNLGILCGYRFLCWYFGVNLGALWECGSTQGSLWGYFCGHSVDTLWVTFGILWGHFVCTLGSLFGYSGVALGLLLGLSCRPLVFLITSL